MKNLTTKELFSTFLPEDKAHDLINHFQSLRVMARASHEELLEAGLCKTDIKQVRAVLELTRKYSVSQPKITHINNVSDSYKLLAPLMEDLDQEVVRCILLNERHRVLATPLITIGTLSSCLVDQREIFKEAIRLNAYALILAHQHPSGDPTPSGPDIDITQKAKEAGKILGVNVIDHIIICRDNRYYSFLENNRI